LLPRHHGNDLYQTLCEGNMVRIKLGGNVASLVCALFLMLPLASGLAQAQPAAPVAGASTAAAEVKPAAPAAVASAATPAKSDENPYGIKAVWEQGDLVAKGTLLILIIMSMGSWYVIFTKLLEQSKIAKQAKAVQDSFWSGGSVRQSTDRLDATNPFRFIAASSAR
jgi:biopolymer transport protein ExbB